MSHCDFCKNVTSELLSHRITAPSRAPPTVPSILQPQLITTMYIKLQTIINCQFVVLNTCTQTLFHTQRSRKTQEIFRHNNKRQYFIEPFLTRSMRCKHDYVWRLFLSSPLVLSCLTTAVIGFFSDSGSRYAIKFLIWGCITSIWHPTSQQDYILSSYEAESALVWMGRLQFPLFCFQLGLGQ